MEWKEDDIKSVLGALGELRRLKEREIAIALVRDLRSAETRDEFLSQCEKLTEPLELMSERVRTALNYMSEKGLSTLSKEEQDKRLAEVRAARAEVAEQQQKVKAHFASDPLLTKLWHTINDVVK